MKKTRKLIALLVTMAMLFTCMLSTSVSYAEDEEPEEEVTVEESDSTNAVDSLGGYKGLVAHWKFDGDLNDSTKFSNNGVAVGGKTGITYADGVFGKGVKFDGKSYIRVNDSDSLDLRDEFTFSFWVYKDDMRKKDTMDGGVPYIIKYNEQYKEYPYCIYEWWTMTPGVSFSDGETTHETHSEKQVDLQKWTLITVTYDKESGTVTIYRNNEMVKSDLKTLNLERSSEPLYIGFGHFMTVDNYFKGIMDDMRIYNRALSYTEVEDLYDEGTKASGKNLVNKPDKLVAYYKFENNLNDLSGFKNNGFAVKANNFKYVDGIAGKGVKFNGASYIEVKDSDSLDLDKGFTFGMWIYKEKSKNNQPIFAKYGESFTKTNTSYFLEDWRDSTGLRLTLSNYDNEGEATDFDTDDNNELSDGRWYYYTATYKGADESNETKGDDDNTIKQYVNGKLIKSEKFDGDISNSSGPLWIGGTTEGIYFKGIMDEFRIYNYAMTPSQVKTLYSMRDSLQILPVQKVSLASLKAKQKVQLLVNSLTHLYTSPSTTLINGKEELKKLNVTAKATYKSSNTKVATVSKTGQITTIGKGKTTITVTYGTRSQSVTVVVK